MTVFADDFPRIGKLPQILLQQAKLLIKLYIPFLKETFFVPVSCFSTHVLLAYQSNDELTFSFSFETI